MAKSFSLKSLCTPAFVYLALSVFGLLLIVIENLNSGDDKLCIAQQKCNVTNKPGIMILNVLYILFWTFILDLLCKSGYTNLSWLILLLPIIMYVITLVLMVLYLKV